ncbi:DUF1963 domain-containing protein [Pontimicrobium sp. SW4]|uniref:DUF1963 domain-containing protein n=1 Tax=Pontimicrobium sp. SW4 TaxID=3153519 RepID=A0AAU7BPG1_9FLAO
MNNDSQTIEESINQYMINNHINVYAILLDLIKPTIAFKKSEKSKNISKFGGIPLFSDDLDMDRFNIKSLSHLCQISVDEIMPYNEFNYFFDGGMISFFINLNLSFPIRRSDYKVFYHNCKKEYLTQRHEHFVNSPVLDEMFIDFYLHYNFPSYQNYKMLELETRGINLDEEIDEIQDFIDTNNNHFSNNIGSQLFGNPQAVQGTVSFHWAASALNLSYPFTDQDLKKINEIEKEYILLLQVDFSDINVTENFGDGMLYFGIKKEDLMRKDFDNVELVYQST